jgi:hypothetical protein
MRPERRSTPAVLTAWAGAMAEAVGSACFARLTRRRRRLIQVLDDIIDVLDTDR